MMPPTIKYISDDAAHVRLEYQGPNRARLLTSVDEVDRWLPADSEWEFMANLRIKEFGLLAPGWDGYGAHEISDQAMKTAQQFVGAISRLTRKPFISPTSVSGVAFEWDGPGGTTAIEIDDLGQSEVRCFCGPGREWFGPLGEEPNPLEEMIDWVEGS